MQQARRRESENGSVASMAITLTVSDLEAEIGSKRMGAGEAKLGAACYRYRAGTCRGRRRCARRSFKRVCGPGGLLTLLKRP